MKFKVKEKYSILCFWIAIIPSSLIISEHPYRIILLIIQIIALILFIVFEANNKYAIKN